MADPEPLDLIDQLYLAFGRCCAGCDHWELIEEFNRPHGFCHLQPFNGGVAFDLGEPGPSPLKMYAITRAKWVCGRFADTFDWTTLGVPMPAWRP